MFPKFWWETEADENHGGSYWLALDYVTSEAIGSYAN